MQRMAQTISRVRENFLRYEMHHCSIATLKVPMIQRLTAAMRP
jgi:hypothetical protein